jgi:hypothetical protein
LFNFPGLKIIWHVDKACRIADEKTTIALEVQLFVLEKDIIETAMPCNYQLLISKWIV